MLVAGPGRAGVGPDVACHVKKLKAEGRLAAGSLACHGAAAKKGVAVDPACLAKSGEVFLAAVAKAESAAAAQGGHCLVEGDAATIRAQVDGFVNAVVGTLRLAPDVSRCTAAKLKAMGRHALRVLIAHAANTKKVNPKKLAAMTANADNALAKAVAVADGLEGGNCFVVGDGGTGDSSGQLAQGSLPSCEQRTFSDGELDAAAALAMEGAVDPWAAGLAAVVATTAANLSCNAPPPGSAISALGRGREVASLDCAGTYCPGTMYCGPGNAQSNPGDYHPTVGQCLNQACYQHDLCYNPYCVDVAQECYFTGQGGSGQCDIDLKNVCDDPACKQADAATGAWVRRATCAVVDHLIERDAPEICSQAPCEGMTCNTSTGVCTTPTAQCCIDNQGCPGETGTVCGATCCCCGTGERCCADNSGCCPS